jgi:hypothetical protein
VIAEHISRKEAMKLVCEAAERFEQRHDVSLGQLVEEVLVGFKCDVREIEPVPPSPDPQICRGRGWTVTI